jgi:hypothetical protein
MVENVDDDDDEEGGRRRKFFKVPSRKSFCVFLSIFISRYLFILFYNFFIYFLGGKFFSYRKASFFCG